MDYSSASLQQVSRIKISGGEDPLGTLDFILTSIKLQNLQTFDPQQT